MKLRLRKANRKSLPLLLLIALIIGIAAVFSLVGVTYLKTSFQNKPRITPVEHRQLPTSQVKIAEGWRIYRNEELRFSINYPGKGWVFLTGQTSMVEPPLSFKPIGERVNLYTTRTPPEGVWISVAVYRKSNSRPLPQWLLSGYITRPSSQVEIVQQVEKIVKLEGDIDTALTKAYSGKTGILTYKQAQSSNIKTYQIGAVLTYGKLSYSTYLTKNGTNIYAIAVDLPLNPPDGPYEDLDSFFTNVYQEIVSSFKLLD